MRASAAKKVARADGSCRWTPRCEHADRAAQLHGDEATTAAAAVPEETPVEEEASTLAH
jgi:hypothetical protein